MLQYFIFFQIVPKTSNSTLFKQHTTLDPKQRFDFMDNCLKFMIKGISSALVELG